MKNTEANTKFNIYLSYPVERDNKAMFFTQLQDYTNIGIEIRAWLLDWEKMDSYPSMTLYIPSEHEPFVHTCYLSRLLSKQDISYINNKIVSACKLLILFGDTCFMHSDNTKSEIECAQKNDVAIYTMPDLSPIAIDALKFTIKTIIKVENEDEEI